MLCYEIELLREVLVMFKVEDIEDLLIELKKVE